MNAYHHLLNSYLFKFLSIIEESSYCLKKEQKEDLYLLLVKTIERQKDSSKKEQVGGGDLRSAGQQEKTLQFAAVRILNSLLDSIRHSNFPKDSNLRQRDGG
jgi:hypothetical protein